jgi:HSP20 family molecular chaperone IbpA
MSTENRLIQVDVGRPAPDPSATAGAGTEGPGAGPPRAVVTPLIDIHEGPDGLVLEADLPGTTEDRVTIRLEDNVLSLHASVPSPGPDGARPLHEEYHAGDFDRSFILSDEVERGRITAELKNGVLRLTLPRADRSKTRRIEIQAP